MYIWVLCHILCYISYILTWICHSCPLGNNHNWDQAEDHEDSGGQRYSYRWLPSRCGTSAFFWGPGECILIVVLAWAGLLPCGSSNVEKKHTVINFSYRSELNIVVCNSIMLLLMTNLWNAYDNPHCLHRIDWLTQVSLPLICM